MEKPRGWILWVIPCIVLGYAFSVALGQTGPTVASLVFSPSTIAGGTGGTSTGTVTLNGLAPAGGTLVALSSSNPGLAASRQTVLVDEGTGSAIFTVATNGRYRRYSGLSFSATISASASSGPSPIALSPGLIESGSASQGTLSLASPAPSGSDGLVGSSNSQTTAFPTGFFPIPTGATAVPFHVATSILPSIEFSSVGTSIEIPVPIKKGGIFLSHRLGLAWLAMTPPEPPPAQPVQTLGQLSVDGDPVTGGNNSIAS